MACYGRDLDTVILKASHIIVTPVTSTLDLHRTLGCYGVML
jgi:hypothetical protein